APPYLHSFPTRRSSDLKELYWHLDNTPSHSYMRMLYRYPQARFPYEQLVGSNAARSRAEPEFELWQTNVLAENRYFDIEISYARSEEHTSELQSPDHLV